ncbi:MAG TPA: MFS transporter [Tepidiformaceae bacterium]|nr:MFS transporter [Tepidiformaceae bacterium]
MTEPALPLFQRPPFRRLSFSRFFSRVAQNGLNFALVLLIVDETGRAFMSGLLVLALVIPATVAGIVAGTLADNFPKRLILFVANLARACLCLAFILAAGGVPSYFVVAVTLATFTQFAGSAEGAILPAIIPRHDLAKANAIGQAITGVAQIAGFVILTPLMLRVFDSPDALFAVAAVLFVLGAVYAVGIGRIPSVVPLEVGARNDGRWWLTGWREMRRDPRVLHAAIELTLIATSLIILGGLIPTYIQDVLDLPVEIGAVVFLPAAIGVATGLRIASFLARRIPHALLSTSGFVGFVVLLFVVTFTNPLAEFLGGYGWFSWLNSVRIGRFDGGGVVAMIAVLPLGFSYAVVSVAAQTVLNDLVPLHLQGRVLATQGALAAIAASLPVLLAGALSDRIGVTPVMALLATAIGFAAVMNLRGPRVTSADTPYAP